MKNSQKLTKNWPKLTKIENDFSIENFTKIETTVRVLMYQKIKLEKIKWQKITSGKTDKNWQKKMTKIEIDFSIETFTTKETIARVLMYEKIQVEK